MLVIPVRLAIGVALAAALLAGAGVAAVQPAVRDAAAAFVDPRATADPATLDRQRTATERAIQRGYLKATGQLDEVRRLTLPISPAQATSIDERARADLRGIRRDALAAVGARMGLAQAALEAYVTGTEGQLGDKALPDARSVLLAPDLHAIVARANELFQGSADAATRELTRSSAPTPSPTGR